MSSRPLLPSRRVPRFGALLAATLGLALVALAVAGSPAARADGRAIHPVLREFLPTGKYVFDAGAGASRPSVYFSQRAAAYLVRGTALGRPVLVLTGSSAVESFPDDMIVCRSDGGCDLAADVKPTSLGTYRVQGPEIVIQVPGLDGRLKPRPPLEGWLTGADLRTAQPEYVRDAKKYQADEAAIADLRKTKGEVRIFVYFGCWCSTCSMLMGRILHLEDALTGEDAGGARFHFDFYASPPVPRFYQDAEIVNGQIERLPTGLVFVDGQFAGRIVSTAWTRPESALRSLLQQRR
jgi:hypothetical protein